MTSKKKPVQFQETPGPRLQLTAETSALVAKFKNAKAKNTAAAQTLEVARKASGEARADVERAYQELQGALWNELDPEPREPKAMEKMTMEELAKAGFEVNVSRKNGSADLIMAGTIQASSCRFGK